MWKQKQMPTITVAFKQAPYVLATFVHISNNSAVSDPILTKLFAPNFLWTLICVKDQKEIWTKLLLTPNGYFASGLKLALDILYKNIT